ncbi:hypothetical protein VNO77_15498 [Canavalia gladiata]|uniref:Sacsin/Nov domain-containing protein n=1 Tax=Canavalia gladiata TaxID=3824 RepID=A0AAN9LZ45_CANGL
MHLRTTKVRNTTLQSALTAVKDLPSDTQRNGSIEGAQGDRAFIGLVLALAQLSGFIEQTVIPKTTEDIIVSFAGGSVRSYEAGPAFVPGWRLEKDLLLLTHRRLRLFLAGDLVYNDAPWLLGLDNSNGSFCNSSTVLWNARRTIQKFSSDSMNFGLCGATRAFGQHEALTITLKHILKIYVDGLGTLFELVQNAEDVGAFEVIFLLDKSQYGTSSILSPEMVDWLGRALYYFNDLIFGPQDTS